MDVMKDYVDGLIARVKSLETVVTELAADVEADGVHQSLHDDGYLDLLETYAHACIVLGRTPMQLEEDEDTEDEEN